MAVGKAAGAAPPYTRVLAWAVQALAIVAGLGILAIIAITCLDIALRIFSRSLTGTVDLVRVLSGVVLACALPYTTAAKGHIAVEYFFEKLHRWPRRVVDVLVHLTGMALFAVLAWQSVGRGLVMLRKGRVSDTLELPIFWVPWVIALGCGLVVLVLLHALVHPRQQVVKP